MKAIISPDATIHVCCMLQYPSTRYAIVSNEQCCLMGMHLVTLKDSMKGSDDGYSEDEITGRKDDDESKGTDKIVAAEKIR
jgi:hypothetical protein